MPPTRLRSGLVALRLATIVAITVTLTGCGGGEGGKGWFGSNKKKESDIGSIQEGSAAKEESVFMKRPGAGKSAKGLGIAYQDGFNDGRASSTDWNMNWMKNWGQDADFRAEYERGWKDGRNLRKMQDQMKSGRAGKVRPRPTDPDERHLAKFVNMPSGPRKYDAMMRAIAERPTAQTTR